MRNMKCKNKHLWISILGINRKTKYNYNQVKGKKIDKYFQKDRVKLETTQICERSDMFKQSATNLQAITPFYFVTKNRYKHPTMAVIIPL